MRMCRGVVLLPDGVRERREIHRLQGQRQVSRLGAGQLVQVIDQGKRAADVSTHAIDARLLFRRQRAIHAEAQELGEPVGGADGILHVVTEAAHQSRATLDYLLQHAAPLVGLLQQADFLVGQDRQVAEDAGTSHVLGAEVTGSVGRHEQRAHRRRLTSQRHDDGRAIGMWHHADGPCLVRLRQILDEHRLAARRYQRRVRAREWACRVQRRHTDACDRADNDAR